jgi:hypothetical protein
VHAKCEGDRGKRPYSFLGNSTLATPEQNSLTGRPPLECRKNRGMEREIVALEPDQGSRPEARKDRELRVDGDIGGTTEVDQTVEALIKTANLIETDFGGGIMALKDLERLTGELENLALMLREEHRPQARWVILERVQEIMNQIGEGLK